MLWEGVIDCAYFADEIINAKAYNLKYQVKVKRKNLSKEHPNAHDKFYARMPESEKERLAQGYLTFIEYYEIYKNQF